MTLPELMSRKIYDSHRPEALEGKDLLDFVPSLMLRHKYSGEFGMAIFKGWAEHFRGTDTPFIIAWDESSERLSLWKEKIVSTLGSISKGAE